MIKNNMGRTASTHSSTALDTKQSSSNAHNFTALLTYIIITQTQTQAQDPDALCYRHGFIRATPQHTAIIISKYGRIPKKSKKLKTEDKLNKICRRILSNFVVHMARKLLCHIRQCGVFRHDQHGGIRWVFPPEPRSLSKYVLVKYLH
jgi:phosphoribosylformylglycinamidine (FGAM) synthase PurS component